MNISGLFCHRCYSVVFSRSRHDMRFCQCGAIAIDGGRDYSKVCYQSLDDFDICNITLQCKITASMLYQDWNKMQDKYGLHFITDKDIKVKIEDVKVYEQS